MFGSKHGNVDLDRYEDMEDFLGLEDEHFKGAPDDHVVDFCPTCGGWMAVNINFITEIKCEECGYSENL